MLGMGSKIKMENKVLVTIALLGSVLGSQVLLADGLVIPARPIPAPRPPLVIARVLPIKIPAKYNSLQKSRLNQDTQPDVDWRNDIASWGLPIRNQGSRNTCSVYVMTFLLEYAEAKWLNERNLDLSEEYLNYVANLGFPNPNDGGFFTELNNGYQIWGISRESDVPYQATFMTNLTFPNGTFQRAQEFKGLKFEIIKPWNNTMGATAEQIRSAATAILLGMPVGMGALWQKDTTDLENIHGLNFIKTPARDQMADGHSVALVGFKYSTLFPGGGYFVFRNSWDVGFGDDGYAYVSFDFVKKYANDLVYFHR